MRIRWSPLLLTLVSLSLAAQTPVDMAVNGSFEQGTTGWTGTTATITTSRTPYDGTRHAWLAGNGKTATENLVQTVTIPADATKATLSFAVFITTSETENVVYDTLKVQVRNSSGTVLSTLATLSNLNKTTGYKLYSYDLTAYKGQTVQVNFLATEDASLATSFDLDAVKVLVEKGATGVDLTVDNVYVTQATQKYDKSVPLVADRRGLLRVFVKAAATNTLKPAVKVKVYHGSTLAKELALAPPSGMTGVPTAPTETDYTNTYSTVLGAELIKAGLRFEATVDPSNLVPESNEANNTWAGAAEDVRVLAPFRTTLVPLRMPSTGKTSVASTSTAESYVEMLRRLHPVPEALDVQVHAVYTTSVQLSGSYDGTWSTILNEMDALRKAEGKTNRHYYGAINNHTSGGTGMAYIGGFAGIGVEWTTSVSGGSPGTNWRNGTFAHELGHNLGRKHAPCGGPAGVDPNYPYSNADIGAHGYDVWNARALNGSSGWSDVMAYCGYDWTSDYGYKVSLNWRASNATLAAPAVVEEGRARECLLVWGRLEEGRAILEPAFRVQGIPDAPDPDGDQELEFTQGGVTYHHRFHLQEMDHKPGHGFALLLPVREAKSRALGPVKNDVLVWHHEGGILAQHQATRTNLDLASAPEEFEPLAVRSGDGTPRVRMTWDPNRHTGALVRDARTGEILAIGRRGVAEFHTEGREVRVQFSNGLEQRESLVRVQ